MAGDGAILVTKDGKVYETMPPKGKVVNSVGAGDSMVAGFITGYLNTKDMEKAFRLGVAAGSASAFCSWLATRDEIVGTSWRTGRSVPYIKSNGRNDKMKITDLLKKQSICHSMARADSKEQVIREMVDLMAEGGNINDIDTYRETVFKREEEGTTGIGEGIAIPHGKTEAVSAPDLQPWYFRRV